MTLALTSRAVPSLRVGIRTISTINRFTHLLCIATSTSKCRRRGGNCRATLASSLPSPSRIASNTRVTIALHIRVLPRLLHSSSWVTFALARSRCQMASCLTDSKCSLRTGAPHQGMCRSMLIQRAINRLCKGWVIVHIRYPIIRGQWGLGLGAVNMGTIRMYIAQTSTTTTLFLNSPMALPSWTTNSCFVNSSSASSRIPPPAQWWRLSTTTTTTLPSRGQSISRTGK